SLNNLAGLYDTQGQYAKAEPLYREALRILEKSLPPDHPNLGTVMKNYGALLGELNRATEAREWQGKAEAIRQRHTQHNPEAQ
ncbi:MAG TPA: tetratricopeptide repeat protein, partial [Burkholderiales bacterium]|nr:tetratricopeptide repeat protein [Burkholderiales bacterium]